MHATDMSIPTETKLKRITWLSSQDKSKRFNALMHHINIELLRDCFHRLDGKKAVGVDGIDKASYANNLEENLTNLEQRLKRMSYRPGPVREVLIPKFGSKNAHRRLGISNFEDKLVQKSMQKVLNSIYEPIFLNCSYGFREGRGCHDAVRALRDHLYRSHVRVVIDLDLADFFNSIEQSQLEVFLREKIGDDRFMRYINRQFKAGILSAGELQVSDEGVVQGSALSPMLANIFAHYVIDEWFEGVVKHHCLDEVKLFRYGDDAVICCRSESDARRIRKAIGKRLEKYKLKLNEDKTRNVLFSKWAYKKGQRQGTFDFLGFTFYWGKSRSGALIPKVKTSGKRIRAKLKNVNVWAKQMKGKHKLRVVWKMFCQKLVGHIQYYGVSFNNRQVNIFLYYATRIMFKWLNRRSQKKSFTWDKFRLFVKANPLPPVKVHHSLW